MFWRPKGGFERTPSNTPPSLPAYGPGLDMQGMDYDYIHVLLWCFSTLRQLLLDSRVLPNAALSNYWSLPIIPYYALKKFNHLQWSLYNADTIGAI